MSAAGGAGGPAASPGENVQVCIRIRPLNRTEREHNDPKVIACDSKYKEVVVRNKTTASDKTFTFDNVFGPDVAQEQLFKESVCPVVDEVLKGYSCTVFAYGQTGTGKTYTMEGLKKDDGTGICVDTPEAGIIARAVKHVFKRLEESGTEWSVKISFLEIYNERLDDLFAPEPSTFMSEAANKPLGPLSGKPRNLLGEGVSMPAAGAGAGGSVAAELARERLKIVVDEKRGGLTRVQNLEELVVTSAEDVFAQVSAGIAKRATAETACNAQSSRSHCVFTLTIHSKESSPEGEEVIRIGKLNLVDLAGSECVGRSGAKDARAREAGNINQSLLTLGRVITALVEKHPHIPYRDSKLTRLLQDSLGGRTKTCIIATLSPALSSIEESLSTLEYANRAKNIKNRPEANAKIGKQTLMREYAGELEALRTRLAAQVAKDGYICVSPEEYEGLKRQVTELGERLQELEALKLAQSEELAALRSELEAVKGVLESTAAKLEATEAELKGTQGTLAKTEQQLAAEERAHQESRFVLRATAETEKGLSVQASGLLQTLQGSVSDVSGLHAKVARLDRQLLSNRQASEQYSAGAAGRLSELKQQVEALAGLQAENADTLKQQLSSMASACMDQLQGVQGKAAAAVEGAQSLLRGMSSAATAAAEDSSKLAEAYAASSENKRASHAAAAEESVHALAEQLAGLQTALQQHNGLLLVWQASVHEAVEVLSREVSSFVSHRMAPGLQKAAEMVHQQEQQLQDMLQGQAEEARKQKAARASAAEAAAAELQATLSAALSKFVSEQKAAAEEQCSSVVAATAAAAASVKSGSAELRGQLAGVGHSGDEWAAGMHGKLQGLAASTAEQHSSSKSSVEAVSEALADYGAAGREAVQACEQRAVEAFRASASFATGSKSSSAAFASKSKSIFVSGSETLASQGSALRAAAGGWNDSLQAGLQAAQGMNDLSLSTALDSAAKLRQWIAADGTALQSFFSAELRLQNERTGATPAKKEYQAPVRLLATSPEERLLSRFREARQQAEAGAEGAGAGSSSASGSASAAAVDAGALLQLAMPPLMPLQPTPAASNGNLEDTAAAAAGRERSGSISEETVAVLSSLVVVDTTAKPSYSQRKYASMGVAGSSSAAIAVAAAGASALTRSNSAPSMQAPLPAASMPAMTASVSEAMPVQQQQVAAPAAASEIPVDVAPADEEQEAVEAIETEAPTVDQQQLQQSQQQDDDARSVSSNGSTVSSAKSIVAATSAATTATATAAISPAFSSMQASPAAGPAAETLQLQSPPVTAAATGAVAATPRATAAVPSPATAASVATAPPASMTKPSLTGAAALAAGSSRLGISVKVGPSYLRSSAAATAAAAAPGSLAAAAAAAAATAQLVTGGAGAGAVPAAVTQPAAPPTPAASSVPAASTAAVASRQRRLNLSSAPTGAASAAPVALGSTLRGNAGAAEGETAAGGKAAIAGTAGKTLASTSRTASAAATAGAATPAAPSLGSTGTLASTISRESRLLRPTASSRAGSAATGTGGN